MHNDGDSANVILPHFAYGVHMFSICDTLKVREVSNTKTAGFCRSAPRTGVVWAETCTTARNITAVTTRDHKRNAKATKKKKKDTFIVAYSLANYRLWNKWDAWYAYGNENCLQNSFRNTANRFFMSSPRWGGSKIVWKCGIDCGGSK
jgi:hypothetical protein